MEQRKLENYEYRKYYGSKNGVIQTHYLIKEENQAGCLYYAIKIENFPETKPMSFFELLDNFKEPLTEDMVKYVEDKYWSDISGVIELLNNINKSIINDMVVDIHNKNDEKRIQEYEKYLQNLINEPYYKEDIDNPYYDLMYQGCDFSEGYKIENLHNQTFYGSQFKNKKFRHIEDNKIIFESGDADEIYNYLKEYGVEKIIEFHAFKINGKWLNMAGKFSFKENY